MMCFIILNNSRDEQMGIINNIIAKSQWWHNTRGANGRQMFRQSIYIKIKRKHDKAICPRGKKKAGNSHRSKQKRWNSEKTLSPPWQLKRLLGTGQGAGSFPWVQLLVETRNSSYRIEWRKNAHREF